MNSQGRLGTQKIRILKRKNQASSLSKCYSQAGSCIFRARMLYKLHHGVWILITLGTHCLKETGEISIQLTNTFVPLIYLFCKNHESNGAKILK